jgi:MFS family permease
MKVYFGWVIVAASVLVYMLVVGGVIQAYSMFVLPVSQAFHLTRAQTNTGAIVLNIGMAIAGPIVGRMVDRHSVRRVMAVSALALGTSLVILGLSSSLLLSTAVIATALAGGVVGCGSMAMPVLVARWFKNQRGRAMAISTLGVSAGAVVTIPLISLLLETFGWRHCLMLMGVAWAAVLMLLAAVIRDEPGPSDIEPGSPPPADDADRAAFAAAKPLGLGELLRFPQFWAIALASALIFAILTTTIISFIPFAQGEGLSVAQAASAMSIYGAAALIGSLLFAWLGDRFARLMIFAMLAAILGLAAGSLAIAHSYVAILASTAVIGVAGGGFTPAYLALLADCFGAGSFGIASGAASFISTFVSAIGIRFGGEIFDRTGSYHTMFVSFLAIGAFACGLALTTRLIPLRHPRVG